MRLSITTMRSIIKNIKYFKTIKKKCYFGKNVQIKGNVCFGNNVKFDDNVEVRNLTKTSSSIGDRVAINRNSVIRGYFRIGNDVAIAPNCTIIGSNHNFDRIDVPINKQGSSNRGGVVVEDDVWIGANCVVLDGVTIGKGCVIGAGSIVTKSIPPYSVAVGNPCKVIKSRK